VRYRGLWLAAALVLGAGSAPGAPERSVVLISIDGLRPAFYLEPGWAAPELRGLARAGAHARAAEPVFPTVTYPNHASIATGVRPVFHGIAFNTRFDPAAVPPRWYDREQDLRARPVWAWARAAGLSTAAISWPSTVGAGIDALVPEQDYYARPAPLERLLRASTPGLFERLHLTPGPETFGDVTRWDAFLAVAAVAMIREASPRLLLLHLVGLDMAQHRSGPDGDGVGAALERVDRHVGEVLAALRAAGVASRTAVIVAGDHGFASIHGLVFPNAVLARAGLRPCPWAGDGWRASVHVAGTVGAVFVNPPGDADAVAAAEAALRAAAAGHYTFVSRAQLDGLGALPNAAVFVLEAAPGLGMGEACDRGVTASATGGGHGYLPGRPEMAAGFVAAGAGLRPGVALDRIRLIDIAPTLARLLGVPAPPVEGRVLEEILE
jgi:predicted AlkP superfamily pyrophosphatase or phosphodiesterase